MPRLPCSDLLGRVQDPKPTSSTLATCSVEMTSCSRKKQDGGGTHREGAVAGNVHVLGNSRFNEDRLRLQLLDLFARERLSSSIKNSSTAAELTDVPSQHNPATRSQPGVTKAELGAIIALNSRARLAEVCLVQRSAELCEDQPARLSRDCRTAYLQKYLRVNVRTAGSPNRRQQGCGVDFGGDRTSVIGWVSPDCRIFIRPLQY